MITLVDEPVPARRLRPNPLLDLEHAGPFPEDGWLGCTLRIGTIELRIVSRCQRCMMVGHSQAALESRPRLLKRIGTLNAACAGVYAKVTVPGDLSEGDSAILT